MGPWVRTLGGILKANGFQDFLANFSATRGAADPMREALSILAFHASGMPKRSGELARVAVTQGLAKILLPGVDPANPAACERTMGVTLRPYVGERFIAATATEKITYLLKKESKRWEGDSPHFRYMFEEVGREAVSEDAVGGLVLESPASSSNLLVPEDPDLRE